MKKIDFKDIEKKLKQGRAIDVAQFLTKVKSSELEAIIDYLEFDEIALIFEQAQPFLQKKILNLLTNQEIVLVLKHMAIDDVVDALKYMNIAFRNELFKEFDSEYLDKIKSLISYNDDQAGALMTLEYLALDESKTVKETLDYIRKNAQDFESLDVIFTLENNKFKSCVNISDILIASENEKLVDIAEIYPITVESQYNKKQVAFLMSKYDLKAIPVVESGKILGIITIDDIVDVIVEDANNNLLKLAGSSEQESVYSSILFSIKSRLPWLLVNLVTAFLASITVGMFSDIIAKVVALAAINPIIAGMGGNAGAQELAIVIRAITLNEIDIKQSFKFVYKQVIIGLINGLVIGLITGLIMSYSFSNIYLLIIILLSMIVNLILAGVMGYLIPITLKALKQDPALASSIFLTTVTDVCGFFVFLTLASIFIDKLI